MSFPRYSNYKNSRVAWLGEVPTQWTLSRVSYLFRAGKGKHGQKLTQEFLSNNSGDYPVYSGQTQDDGLMGTWNEYEFDFPNDGVLFSTTVGAKAMHLKHLSGKFSLSQNCLILWPIDMRCDIRFFYYHLQPLFAFERGKIPEHMQASFRIEDLYSFPICLPSVDEQQAIASFLDVETSKIDSLVAEQRRLIELLKEKRQAVISHAVTKGLNPNAPMKPSGIQWLGGVPEHWEVRRIKHAITSIEQGWSPQCENDPVQSEDQWGVLKVGCVNYGKFTAKENKALPLTLEPQRELGIQRDDLLISRANTIELVGSAAVAERDHSNLMLCDKLYRLRMNHSQLLPEFLCYFLTCEAAREPIELGATGASPSMKNIAQSVILELWFAAPDIEEQKKIIDAIRVRWNAITGLIAEAERAIELLQERRTALISAAVTGKIDVRGYLKDAEAA